MKIKSPVHIKRLGKTFSGTVDARLLNEDEKKFLIDKGIAEDNKPEKAKTEDTNEKTKTTRKTRSTKKTEE